MRAKTVENKIAEFQKDWMHSLEMRAKTVENKIAEFLRKLKNRLFEPKF